MADLPDERPGRALLTAAAAMAGVAILVGLTVGGVLLGVVRASGLEDAQANEEAALAQLPEGPMSTARAMRLSSR